MRSGRIGILYLAVQNLRRRPGRLVVSALGVVLAAGTLFALLLGFLGIQKSVAVGLDRLGADLLVVPAGAGGVTQEALVMGSPTMFYMDGSVEEAVAAVPGVAAVSGQVFVETLASSACCTGRVFVVGYDPTTDFTVGPWLTTHLKRTLGPDEVVVGNLLLYETGDLFKLYGTDFAIAARLYPTGMGMDETVFLPRESVYAMARASAERAEQELRIPPGAVSAVLVRVEPGAAPQQVAAAIRERLPEVDVVIRSRVAQQVVAGYRQAIQGVLAAAGAGLATALLLVGILFSAVVNERRRELGLLRAMGGGARDVVRLILVEAALLTGGGGLVGVLVGGGLFFLFQPTIQQALQVPYLWPSAPQLLGLAGATVALAALAGLLAAAGPALRMARREPYDAIRAGGA